VNANRVWIGNKKDNVTVIYTPWSNLKKDGSMAVGQVGFHNQKMVCSFHMFCLCLYHIFLSLSHVSSLSVLVQPSFYLSLPPSCPSPLFTPRPHAHHLTSHPQVKRLHVAQRLNPIVNRLNKTKVEKFPDLRQEKEDRLRELRGRDRGAQLARQKEEKRIARENKEKAWQKEHAYDDIFTEEAMEATNNQDRGSDFEDDFM
jgi:hypothetical protein